MPYITSSPLMHKHKGELASTLVMLTTAAALGTSTAAIVHSSLTTSQLSVSLADQISGLKHFETLISTHHEMDTAFHRTCYSSPTRMYFVLSLLKFAASQVSRQMGRSSREPSQMASHLKGPFLCSLPQQLTGYLYAITHIEEVTEARTLPQSTEVF